MTFWNWGPTTIWQNEKCVTLHPNVEGQVPHIPAPICPDKPGIPCLLFLSHVTGRARSHMEGQVPYIPAPTCPDKTGNTQRATCLLCLHPCALTSPFTRGGPRPHASYSCTQVPRQAWYHVEGHLALISAPTCPDKPSRHVEGCVLYIPAPMCRDKPCHTWRAVCLLFLHLCARTSPLTTQRAACLEFTACTPDKTGECRRKPGVRDSVCVIESFQPCDCWCYFLVLLVINLETCQPNRLIVHIRSKEFRNRWTQRFSVFQNFRNMYFWD